MVSIRRLWVGCGMGVAALGLAACSSTSVRVGGAPDVAVRNCVAAAVRDLKVPASAIDVMSGATPRDGVYAVNLAVGANRRSAVCSVDENGIVGGVVYKRAE